MEMNNPIARRELIVTGRNMCLCALLGTGVTGCAPSIGSVNLLKGVEPRDTKEIFRELGTCSRTFFFILNREFGHQKELEELASDPLAGGVMANGHQCGMLWGASMAVGAES